MSDTSTNRTASFFCLDADAEDCECSHQCEGCAEVERREAEDIPDDDWEDCNVENSDAQ